MFSPYIMWPMGRKWDNWYGTIENQWDINFFGKLENGTLENRALENGTSENETIENGT